MSISSALSNALSGLTVSSRAADVVASNIANAMTDGYGVRSLDIAARVTGSSGAGAQVTGVTRFEDPLLTGSRRQSDATLAGRQAQTDFLTRIEGLIGTPDEPQSLSARGAAFEAALIAAAGTPQSDAQLAGTVDAARTLVRGINDASAGIQAERQRADQSISDAVTLMNIALEDLADLNTRIRRASGNGREVSGLLDAQAQRVDSIAALVPLTTRRDENGALQIYSKDGEALLDGRAARLGFTPSTAITPDMTRVDGDLSGLTLNGRPIPMDGTTPRLQGGALSALFEIRDTLSVGAQARLDGVARDLAERFQAPGLDPTLAAGAAGLFTDAGQPVLAAAETGLSGRLRLNAAVDPREGGAAWRLRDGLSAAAQGPVGQAGLLNSQIAALAAPVLTASAAFSSSARGFADLLSDNLSATGTARQTMETAQSGAVARQAALQQAELARGVDTDAEMQRLLQIEQSFAANARVISAAEDMMDQLMSIGR